MTLNIEMKEIFDRPEIWRAIYYSRFGNCSFKLETINWKNVCTDYNRLQDQAYKNIPYIPSNKSS